MDNKSLVKRELLRRKIKEHWTKNPNAKSLIVKAAFGDIKTFWHVVKEGKSHKVTEVDTKKESFLIGEIGWPYVEEQEPKKKKEKGDKKSKDKEKSENPDKDKEKPEPSLSNIKPAGEMGGEEEDDKEVGLEKEPMAEPTIPPGEMAGEEVPGESPKSGEEMELQRIVRKKPLMGVDVVADDEGGHIVLKFPGEGNDVTIDVLKDGKVTYTYKERPRTLKIGAETASEEI